MAEKVAYLLYLAAGRADNDDMSICGHADITIWADSIGRVHPHPCSLPAGHSGGHWYGPDPEPRGAWGERFEYEGEKFDPCIEDVDPDYV